MRALLGLLTFVYPLSLHPVSSPVQPHTIPSTMQLVTKLSSPNFTVLRYLEPSILGLTETLRVKRQHPNSQLPHTSNSVQNCALSPTPLCSSMM
jgi:hypothetical protein